MSVCMSSACVCMVNGKQDSMLFASVSMLKPVGSIWFAADLTWHKMEVMIRPPQLVEVYCLHS